MSPLSRNFRDWLYAFALVGMLLRVSMPLWALPQMSGEGFMLMCTSFGLQWQIGSGGDDGFASQQQPCALCGAHLASLPAFPFAPSPVPQAVAPGRPRFAEALALTPPFLVAPPGRGPPAFS